MSISSRARGNQGRIDSYRYFGEEELTNRAEICQVVIGRIRARDRAVESVKRARELEECIARGNILIESSLREAKTHNIDI